VHAARTTGTRRAKLDDVSSTEGAAGVEPPAELDPDDLDDPDDPDGVIVLPWWNNPVNLIAIAIGLILVIGSLGWVLGNNHAQPDPNNVDVGFLQDMRWHHEQATTISFAYLGDAGTDPALYEEAQEIVVGQEEEIGLMVQLLRDYGKPEANETNVGMAWMGEPVPIDSMPGMASDAEIDTLGSLSGAAADQMFVKLMVAHHQGGITMANYAATHANEKSVRDLAASISGNQAEEITEMQQLLASTATT
jgi:uncharacterized protein (DUF305 family)